MRRMQALACASLLAMLAGCGKTPQSIDSPPQAPPAQADAATAAATPEMPAAAPEPDLLAYASGTRIVDKPEDNKGLFMMDSDPINLIDESPRSDWRAKAAPVPVLVFEFPVRTEVERVVFDSAGLNRDEKSPKSVLVEVSDTSKDDGYRPVVDTELKMATDGQSAPVSARVPGRWLRVSVRSNYGDDYVGMTGLHAYGRQLETPAALTGIGGTYEGASGWGKVRLKQEGTRVVGCYEYQQGVLSGGIEGRLLKATMVETAPDGSKSRQLGLFSFSADGKHILGLTRPEDAAPGDAYAAYYAGEKLSGDIGDCPAIPGWKQDDAAGSELGAELQDKGRARLDGINFDFASATLRPESLPLLDRLAALLQANPGWTVTLEGHTDNVGGEAFNQTLSEKRAAAVKDYLAAHGVPAERMASEGFGVTRPVASNESEAGRAQNRRVEIARR